MKNLRFLLTLVAGFSILSGTIAQTKPMNNEKNNKKTPDYSTVERKEIPVQYTWKMEDIYPTLEAWKAEKEKATQMLGQIDGMEKDWTSSANKMLALLQFNEDLGKMAIKLYSYASHQSNVDLANNQYKAMTGELQSLFVEYGTKMAFFNPDVIAMGDEKFQRYLKEQPGLAPYRFSIDNILRGKQHVLPKEQQDSMAAATAPAAMFLLQ